MWSPSIFRGQKMGRVEELDEIGTVQSLSEEK